jgi:hypothetical protein
VKITSLERYRPAIRDYALVATVLIASLLGKSATATTTEKLELAEMVDTADAIVIGHCRGVEMIWAGRSLYTRYRIEVDETLLGASRKEVYVVIPGGIDMNRKHPIALVVPDAPRLQPNEHVALLLREGQFVLPGDMTIVGFNQGHMNLAETNTVAANRQSSPSPTSGAAKLSGVPTAASREQRVRRELKSLIETRGQNRRGKQPTPAAVGSQP